MPCCMTFVCPPVLNKNFFQFTPALQNNTCPEPFFGLYPPTYEAFVTPGGQLRGTINQMITLDQMILSTPTDLEKII